MKEIYLDNSATTVVCHEAAQKALEIMTEKYGNPSSLHSKGFEAQKEIETARKIAADYISADPSEIFFTSGGTEANNTAVFGAAEALKRRGKRIVTTAIEHSSVKEAMNRLKNNGYEVIFLKPSKDGKISLEALNNAIKDDTILVSVMTVNNETGAVQPVEQIKKIIKKSKAPALFHTDAVQAFGKIPINVKKLGADLITFSGHKLHAPKGVGAIYIKKGARIIPLHYGGEQQRKIRPGTEPAPLICAFGKAIEVLPDINEETEFIKKLNDYCRECLLEIDNVCINSDRECLPYIINFSVKGIRSETMLHFLAAKNIFVSSGSACSGGRRSHVLSAMELGPQIEDSAVRVSFSRYNTQEDVNFLISALKEANNTLAKSK